MNTRFYLPGVFMYTDQAPSKIAVLSRAWGNHNFIGKASCEPSAVFYSTGKETRMFVHGLATAPVCYVFVQGTFSIVVTRSATSFIIPTSKLGNVYPLEMIPHLIPDFTPQANRLTPDRHARLMSGACERDAVRVAEYVPRNLIWKSQYSLDFS